MNSKRRLIVGALAIIVALLGASSVMASGGAAPLRQNGAPALLNYQGFLLDPATGDPVPDGNYTLTFAIYDHATSTDPSHRLWNEAQTVSTQGGVFNVILGTTNPLTTDWLDGRDLWLGITVQGESEMTPRTQLASIPYALNANDVRGADIHPHHVYATNGVEVASASSDGVYVGTAGSPSAASDSSDPDGFEVAGAEGDGLSVGRADGRGVHVGSAGGDGVHVFSAGGDGVFVNSATDDGVYVHRAGSPSTTSSSTYHNGFEVAGAQGHGLHVGRADLAGVHVFSAGHAGVAVDYALDNGVEVGSAGGDGVFVDSATDDGVYVHRAGNPSTTNSSTDHNGFEVTGAEGNGLYVGRTDINGVHVHSAGGDGVFVGSAGRYGVWVNSPNDYGVYVTSAGDDGVYVGPTGGDAGYFNGNVQVTGNLSKGAGSFKIDHPLDPQNRYLNHSFVESPDMMNVYNGNVTLDAAGEAWITLPDWFEALNRDFRYQLTPIGAPGPNLYIAQEVKDNRFQIAGGTPGMEVSWQVTGIRHDPYAEVHRIPVEEEKPAEERGTYLHPEVYGQPETMGLAYKEAQAQENRAPPPER